MTVNRTTLLDLPLPVTGTESGTWGDTTNNGLTQYMDIAVAGMTSLTSANFTAGALTLANTTGDSSATNIAASSAQYGAIKVSSLGVASTITAPSSNRRYVIINADATYNLTFKASGQTGVTVVPGEKALVAFNGTDYVKVGGAAGGSTTQVQYNNAGVFGGITNATTDGTTLSMTSPKIITAINDTNANELIKFTATGSAVNEITVANAATGNAPTISATGGDTDVGITLTPKGIGRTTVTQLTTTSPRVLTAINDTNGNELIGVTATGSAVNEITVANAAIGNNPVISATGDDTNIGINLTPKGTGAIKLSGLSYPTADGTANQVIKTNGSGVLSFATVSASPGGSDTYVQFNDGGSFGGDAGLTYNKTTDALTAAGTVTATKLVPTGNVTAGNGMYLPTTNTLAFGTNGTEAMRIDSSGNVGIGVTPPTVSQGRLLSLAYSGSGISVTSGTSLDLTNNAYYNSGWKYGQSGKTARIQLSDDQIYFGNATTGTAGNAITFTQTLAIQQGKTLALEGASLQTGTGITFPATQSASSDANTLDDYEEGTWTPALKFGGNSAGMSISISGKYTKIGNVVYWACDFALSAKGSSSGSATITGLPFTSVTGYYPPSIVWAFNMNSLTGSVVYRVSNNSTTIDIYQYSSTGSNNALTNTEYNDSSQMRATGFYYIS